MKRYVTILVLSGATFLSPLHAQFNLNKLNEGLSGLNNAARAAKEVGKVAKSAAGIGPEEERVIGGSVAVEIVGTYGGLVRDETSMERLNLVGKSLARYSSRPDLDWRFGLLASDSVNAFSAPSGFIFLTKGLYDLLAEDDALAAVLAHEIAHVTERHALKIVSRTEFVSGAVSLATEYNADVRATDAQLRQFDTGISDITKTLFEKGFDPQTEYDADKKGQALTVLTGYSPGAFRGVLLKLKALPATAGAKKIFPTHPSLDSRIKQLPPDPKPAAPAAAP